MSVVSMTEASAARRAVLSADLLARCATRAPQYDRANTFCHDDFDDLREAGYLKLGVPAELGGPGFTMAELMSETRRLAYHAPATALAVNMHHYWVGVAADLRRFGDRSLEWILERAAAGDVFAAGHAESGNDMPVLLATTRAERVDGGYRFHGRKSFGSLSPVWNWFGLHAMDTSDPQAPKVVHAFLPRTSDGYRIVDTWDTLGMRATRSDDTILEGAFVPDGHVARVVPAGPAGLDPFVLSIFARALLGFANIYYGLALRVRDVIVESLKDKTSIAVAGGMVRHPEVQRGVAEIVMELEALGPYLDSVVRDWDAGAEYGHAWVIKIVSAKHQAVEAAWRIADRALDLSGGFGMFKKSELERLFRDARAGRFHPANGMLTHELVGKLTLGVDLAAAPRWA
ncbi:MAG: acyl-CoA/acyl-ACP dehydrogenase [Acidobacteria bacterium]|nr:acyl-CoA/acyl-ACP dehydrogenase [Acidobacteriota bacterium]